MGRRLAACLLAALAAVAVAAPAASALPPIKHVFVIVLENKGFDETFGPTSAAPYLSRTLTSQGQLLTDYYAIGHVSLDNYVALVSGQAPNVQTQSDCQDYMDFAQVGTTSDGQAIGQGCVYPAGVKTVADQLAAKGLTWKGYMEDMGADPVRDNGTTCAHPPLNGRDPTQTAAANDQYATRHNPFVYFHSIIDSPACAANDVPLTRLPADLANPAATASYTFITPGLCHDGHDTPCTGSNEPGGLVSADGFLRTWVPRILGSPAYADGGMLVVTFDEAENNDTTACCGEQSGPNTPSPGGPNGGPGGGRTGAVVISPYTEPGTVNATPYNHYSFLRTVEDLFRLDHLGYAGQAGLRPFGDDVFSTAPAAAAPQPTQITPSGTGTAGSGSCTRPLGKVRVVRGRLPRGTLIASIRIERRSGRNPRLVMRMRHAGRLYFSAGRAGRLRARGGPPSVFACRTYRLALPTRHGSARVAVSLKRGTERWAIRY